MLFPPHGGVPPAVPLTPHPVPPHVPTPPAGLASGGIKSPPPVSSPPLVVTPLMAPLRPAEPIKLPALKDAKAYLDVYDIILYWLRQPEYSTQLLDESLLVTTPSNVEASLFWEGQIQAAVREGSLRFLFDNKGPLYHDKGFEMLPWDLDLPSLLQCEHFVRPGLGRLGRHCSDFACGEGGRL